MTTLQTFQLGGWYEITSEGIATLYFSAIDEGMTTSPTDTPANTVFRPRVLNPDQFSISWAPQAWMHGGDNQDAAFAQLQIDNYDGEYNALTRADLKDTPMTIKLITAGSLLLGTAMHDTAMTICTGIIDRISSAGDVITITLKDTIARLDKALPTKFNPPYVDSGAANTMVPLTFGACRNVAPLLIDSPNRLFQLHDANIPNVTKVADKAAPLDPNATPPQYTPALSGSGLQLQTMPVGKLTADCSSFGSQASIPGAVDVLNGDGAFPDTWSGTNGAPTNFTFSAGTGSAIGEISNPPNGFLGANNGAAIHSEVAFYPAGAKYGEQLTYPSILQGGNSYRLTFKLYNINQCQPFFSNGMLGGVMVASALSANPRDYITGINQPLSQAGFQAQNIGLEFSVPAGTTRDLIFLFVPSEGNAPGNAQGACTATIFDIKLELLGKFVSLPLSGIPLKDYFTEILVSRAGELAGVFNAADLTMDQRDDGSQIPWGIHFDQPPNILAALRQPLGTFNSVLLTDATGALRSRQILNPSDPANQGSVKAAFTEKNIQRPDGVEMDADNPESLSTQFGARRNWSVFSDSDYVTDQAIVPQDTKTRFGRLSQFNVNSSKIPAAEYSFAISANIVDNIMDLAEDQQVLGDEVVGIWSPQIFSDGTSTSGKRMRLKFTALYDDPSAIGIGTTCAVNDLLYGDIVTVDYPERGINNAFAMVLSWEPFPFANKIVLEVLV